MQKKSSILRGGKQSGAESMVTTPFHGVWLRDCG